MYGRKNEIRNSWIDLFTLFGTKSRLSELNKSKTVSDGLSQYLRDPAAGVKSRKYSVPDLLIEHWEPSKKNQIFKNVKLRREGGSRKDKLF